MSQRKPPGAGMTLGEVAELVDGRAEGDREKAVSGIAPVEDAGPDQLGFVALRRYARHAESSRAGAFLVAEELEALLPGGRPRVVVGDAYRALADLLERLHPAHRPPATIHPSAVIGTGARLGADVALGPYTVVGEGAVIGDGSEVHAHAVVGAGAHVGRGCTLHPHAVLYPGARLGDRVVLHAGVKLGADGFGYVRGPDGHRKVPQVGGCVVGDDVEIGANTTVDRGSIGDTVLGAGVKIDNLVQVAHNVRVGARTLMAALVGIAGSTRVGEDVWLGGQVSAINHLVIGDGARVAFASTVMRDVAPGETVSGNPTRPHRETLRKQASVERLPRLLERVEALEQRLKAMEAGSPVGGRGVPRPPSSTG